MESGKKKSVWEQMSRASTCERGKAGCCGAGSACVPRRGTDRPEGASLRPGSASRRACRTPPARPPARPAVLTAAGVRKG